MLLEKKKARGRTKSLEPKAAVFEELPIAWVSKSILSSKKVEDEYELTVGLANIACGIARTGVKKDGSKTCTVYVKSVYKARAKMDTIKLEVELLQSLTWPGLVKFLSVHETVSTLSIVVEAMEDDLLSVADDSVYTEADAAIYIKQMVSLLAHMHQNMIVNLPIRPENFFFANRAKKHIKLVDFRNVIVVDNQRVAAPFLKDDSIFVAPEIRNGEAYGKFSDMWTLGVSMACLLSGGPYFKHKKGVSAPVLDRMPWAKIGEGPKNIVINLLNIDRTARMKSQELLGNDWINGFTFKDEKLRPLHFTQECLAEYKSLVVDGRRPCPPREKASLFTGEGGNFYREMTDRISMIKPEKDRLSVSTKEERRSKKESMSKGSREEKASRDTSSDVPSLPLHGLSKSARNDNGGAHFRTRKLPVLDPTKTAGMLEAEMLVQFNKMQADPHFSRSRAIEALKNFSLVYVLLDVDLLKDFEDFLTHKIYSRENYDFWLDAAKYPLAEAEKRKELAQSLWNEYLTSSSEKEINVPKSIHNHLKAGLEEAAANLFDEARAHVWQLLCHDCFVKFIESDIFVDKYFLYDPTWATNLNGEQ